MKLSQVIYQGCLGRLSQRQTSLQYSSQPDKLAGMENQRPAPCFHDSQEIPTEPNTSRTRAAIANYLRAHSQEKQRDDAQDAQKEQPSAPDSLREPLEEFLRFIPDNEAAQLAFHQLAVKKQNGDLHQHHAQFVTLRGKGLLSDEHGRDHGDTGESSTPESPSEEQRQEQEVYKGHFSVSFEHLGISRGAKWVIGKGLSKVGPERNVDILLAAPGSEHRKYLAPAHAYLRMHIQSGAWMINAGMKCNHVKSAHMQPFSSDEEEATNICPHEPVRCNDRSIRHFEFACLSEPQTSFMVGGLRYIVRFMVNSSALEEIYLQYRNAWLEGQDIAIPDTKVSCIPFDSDVHTKLAVFRQGLGSGTFGTVYEGFEPMTGDLRAVKKLVLRNDADRAETDLELKALDTFRATNGIVKCYGWCTSSGEQQYLPNPPRYPFEIYVSLEKGRSFYQHFHKEGSQVDGIARRNLCWQLLHGLTAIHSKGWMHRDITPMNILYFSREPEHAALCDFGKLCKSRTHTFTALAAWKFLPPEIAPNRVKIYNQKIDIWMLGLALVYSWYPQFQKGKDFRTGKDHSVILNHLVTNDGDDLCLLLASMLAWSPRDRPSAQEALMHDCLQEKPSDDEDLKAQFTARKRLKS